MNQTLRWGAVVASFVVLTGLMASCSSKSGGGGVSLPPPVPPVSTAQLVSTAPSNGAVQVPLSTSVSAQFSQGIDGSSVVPSSFALYLGLGGVNQIPGTLSTIGGKITFQPSSPLKSLSAYHAVVTTQVKDEQGNPLAAEQSWTFWTVDVEAPSVVSTFPMSEQKFVPLEASLQAQFSEPVAPGTVNPSSFSVKGPGGSAVTGKFLIAGESVIFDPDFNFAQDTEYTVTLTSAITDLQSNSLPPYSWKFRATEFAAPVVVSVSPANGAINVPFDNITMDVKFSEIIDPLSVTSDMFKLTGPQGAVPGTLSVIGDTVSFDPSINLLSEAFYTAEIFPGAKDLAGNAYTGTTSWTFTAMIQVLGTPISFAGTESGATPVIAANNAGFAVAVWTQLNGGLKDIYGIGKIPLFGWGTTPAPLENHANNAQGLQIAIDDSGYSYLAYTHFKTASKFNARVKIFQGPSSLTPLDTTVLGNESTLDPTPKIGVSSSGKAVVIWKEKVSGGKANLYYSTATVSTAWTAPALLETDDTGDVKSIDLYIAPNGKGCAVWGQDVGGKQNIYASRYDGTTWSSIAAGGAPELLETNDDGIAKDPLVRGNANGTYFAIWAQKVDVDLNGNINNDKFSLYASQFTPANPAGAWDLNPSLLETSDEFDVKDYDLAVDSLGNAHAVWVQRIAAQGDLDNIYSNSYDAVNLGSWGGAVLVEQNPLFVGTPHVVCPAPNQATMTYISNDDFLYQSLVSASLTLPGSWNQVVPLETEKLSFVNESSLTIDGTGKAMAAWSMQVSFVTKIWVNLFP